MKNLLWLAVLGAVVACGSDEQLPMQDPVPLRQAVTAHVFGEGVDPEGIVAEVDGEPILVAEVAAMALLYPTLTVDAVVSDMIDARVAAGERDDSPAMAFAERDGRARGLFTAWMFDHVWGIPETVSDDDVETFFASDDARFVTGAPRLARVSYVTVQLSGPEAQPEAERVGAEIAASLGMMPGPYTADDLQAAADAVSHSEAVRTQVTRHLTFPRRYAGIATWENGVEVTLEPIAAAGFEHEPGTVAPPFSSPRGVHVLLVEDHLAPDFTRDDRADALARDAILSQRYAARFEAEAGAVFEQVAYTTSPEATELLAATGLERVEASRQERADQY